MSGGSGTPGTSGWNANACTQKANIQNNPNGFNTLKKHKSWNFYNILRWIKLLRPSWLFCHRGAHWIIIPSGGKRWCIICRGLIHACNKWDDGGDTVQKQIWVKGFQKSILQYMRIYLNDSPSKPPSHPGQFLTPPSLWGKPLWLWIVGQWVCRKALFAYWLVELLHHTVSRVCRVFEYAEGGSPTHWAFAAVSPTDHLLLTLGLTHPPSKSHHMMKMRCHQPTIFSDCAFTQTIAKQSAQKMQAGKLNFIFSTDFRPPPLLCFN